MKRPHNPFPVLTAGVSVGLICLVVGYAAAAFVQGGWPDEVGRFAALLFAVVGFGGAVIEKAGS